MNSYRFLMIHGQDPDEWAELFGPLPFSAPCYICGVELTTTIPFVYSKYRGLRAPPCSCGDDKTPYCMVVDPKFGDFFSDLQNPITTKLKQPCTIKEFRKK